MCCQLLGVRRYAPRVRGGNEQGREPVIHVFVETNWVVGFAAPEHWQLPAARTLLARAERGEVMLHLPALCLTEARRTIRARYQPRHEADAIRRYLASEKRLGRVAAQEDDAVRRVLDRFETSVRGEIHELGQVFAALRSNEAAIDVFALDDEMLERSVALSGGDLELEPFDQAILAAVLVRASRLRDGGANDLAFCEIDGDLQPWNRQGFAKQPLTRLYDEAGVWVYGDFELGAPVRPPDWPAAL